MSEQLRTSFNGTRMIDPDELKFGDKVTYLCIGHEKLIFINIDMERPPCILSCVDNSGNIGMYNPDYITLGWDKS